MAKAWTCPSCHVLNHAAGSTCEACGSDRPGVEAPVASRKPLACPIDGALLETKPEKRGFCWVGQGYPQTMPCPFACPICASPLDWDGGCQACHGAPSGRREDWSFPGVGHDLVDGHWRPDPARPVNRRACTDAENAAGLERVRAILDAAPPLSRPDPPPKRAREGRS